MKDFEMKPTPLTGEQLMSLGYNSGDPDGLLEFAKNVVSARDAQWAQVLAFNKPSVDRSGEVQTPRTFPEPLCLAPQPAKPISWGSLQKAAQEIVQSKTLWKRFIDGAPLANDIACWMASFAQDYAAPQPAQPKAEPHSDALSAFASAIRCSLAKPSDWPAYEQGYTQSQYDAEMLQGPPAEDANKQLLDALKSTRELVEHWAGYAGEYFRKKHDINGDLARIDAAIAAAEGDEK